jgi:hypothetical protein
MGGLPLVQGAEGLCAEARRILSSLAIWPIVDNSPDSPAVSPITYGSGATQPLSDVKAPVGHVVL